MRTNVSTTVANCNVFGTRQDRVVSLRNDSCDRAAQHLQTRHAGKRAHSLARALKRRWSFLVGMAGAGPKAKPTCLAITAPARPVVRLTSPAVVLS
jgi:hypothetical protein